MTVWVSGSATAVGCVGRLEDMPLWPGQRWDTLASRWVLGACAWQVAVSLGLRRLAPRVRRHSRTGVVWGSYMYVYTRTLSSPVAVHALVRGIALATCNLTAANVFDACSVSRPHNWAETRRRK